MTPDNASFQVPAPGQTYLAFEGSFPTEPGWIGDDPDPDNPAGRDVIECLLAGVDPAQPTSDIWNEEGFGWSFNCKIGNITVNVLVQYVDHWLVIVHEVSAKPRLLRGEQYAAAVAEVCDRIHRTLSGTPRVARLRWFTDDEYTRLAAAGNVF